jgi:hypothetical protein
MTEELIQNVYVDECGYTGPDLLDGAQPVFVLGSIAASEAECDALKQRFFGGVQAPELKHSNLARRPRGRKMIVELIKHLALRPQMIRIAYAHKEYALVCKMVDLIVEPALHADGMDAYKEGFNIALSNLLYWALPTAIGRAAFNDLLVKFQIMVREPGNDSFEAFHKAVFELSCVESLQGLVDWLKVGYVRLGKPLISTLNPGLLDFSNSFAYYLGAKWANDSKLPIVFVHDDSATMKRYDFFWRAMTDQSLGPVEIGYDRRKMTFPLNIKETRTEGSHKSAGLQIADLIAGSCTVALESHSLAIGPEPDDYTKEIWAIISETFDSLPLWPQMAFTPEELGTVGSGGSSLVDFTTDVISSKFFEQIRRDEGKG